MEDRAELARLAADPATPLATLQELARDHPELRPALALNPSTYPALLEWLGRLGSPDVDAALATRAVRIAAQASGAPPVSQEETATATDAAPTEVVRETAPASRGAAETAPTSQDAQETTVAPTTPPAEAGGPAGAAAAAEAAQVTPVRADEPTEQLPALPDAATMPPVIPPATPPTRAQAPATGGPAPAGTPRADTARADTARAAATG
ncbi:variant leucine-rich repeat-containing protein, partial [Georgenia thermotolerans]